LSGFGLKQSVLRSSFDLNQVNLGANLTTMSDDVPLKLPHYVFRLSNGSFHHKKNVPERLRPLIGKATLYRQLGDSYLGLASCSRT
jgi:hypothetical protein